MGLLLEWGLVNIERNETLNHCSSSMRGSNASSARGSLWKIQKIFYFPPRGLAWHREEVATTRNNRWFSAIKCEEASREVSRETREQSGGFDWRDFWKRLWCRVIVTTVLVETTLERPRETRKRDGGFYIRADTQAGSRGRIREGARFSTTRPPLPLPSLRPAGPWLIDKINLQCPTLFLILV